MSWMPVFETQRAPRYISNSKAHSVPTEAPLERLLDMDKQPCQTRQSLLWLLPVLLLCCCGFAHLLFSLESKFHSECSWPLED